MRPYIGMPCAYRCRPGQARMGQMDLAALVTRVYDDGRADLMIFPPRTNVSDALHYEQVAPMSEAVTGHFWHLNGSAYAPTIVANEISADASGDWMKPDAIAWLKPGAPQLRGLLEKQIEEIGARVAALEAKRGPGRPKAVAA